VATGPLLIRIPRMFDMPHTVCVRGWGSDTEYRVVWETIGDGAER
jgi:hypothetical protein